MSTSTFSPAFDCDVRPDRERVVVSLSGELDIATAPHARETIGALLETGFSQVTVDLRALTFIDSTGLHLLLMASRAAGEQGAEMSLVAGPGAVQRAFALTGLDSALTFEPGRDRA